MLIEMLLRIVDRVGILAAAETEKTFKHVGGLYAY